MSKRRSKIVFGKLRHMILHPLFQGLYKNVVIRSVVLITKMLRAILDLFHTERPFTVLYPNICIKKENLVKTPLSYFSLKVKKKVKCPK